MLATFTYMLFYFLLSQDFEIKFNAKEATFLSRYVDEILITVFIWYRVKIERLFLMSEHQQNDQCVANTARECKKVTSNSEESIQISLHTPSVSNVSQKARNIDIGTLQLHISDFIF